MTTSQENKTEKTKEQLEKESKQWYDCTMKLIDENEKLKKEIEYQQKRIDYFKENYTPNNEYQRAKCILSAMVASSVLIFNIQDFSLFNTILYFIGSIILFFVLIWLIDGLIELTSIEFLSPIISLLSPFIIIALIYIIAFLNYHGFFENIYY